MSRVGLLMRKVGCTSFYDERNVSVSVTLLQLECNVVLSSKKSDGHSIVEVSFGHVRHIKKPQRMYFEKLGVEEEKMGKILRFRVDCRNSPDAMTSLSVDHFKVGQFVDVVGTSIGKGFAGVMKRHNFSGLAASHGVSRAHRSPGSTGNCQDPGRVFKGKKMPGQLGGKRVTMQNLQAHSVHVKRGLLAIRGNVPGHKNSYVLVKDALKKARIL